MLCSSCPYVLLGWCILWTVNTAYMDGFQKKKPKQTKIAQQIIPKVTNQTTKQHEAISPRQCKLIVANCHKPHREQAQLWGKEPMMSVSVSQLFRWLTVHNGLLL